MTKFQSFRKELFMDQYNYAMSHIKNNLEKMFPEVKFELKPDYKRFEFFSN